MLKITVIHGQSHKGSTYNITRQIIDKIQHNHKEIDEYFLPDDGPDFCIGCYKCFDVSEYNCPHAGKVQKIVTSIESSDMIIINSPTYCYGMTGQLKTCLDHLGYMWLAHRPNAKMFNKVAVVISTASGIGANKVVKTLKQQMFWLGISNVFKYSKNVNASSWDTVPEKIKHSIESDLKKLIPKVELKIDNSKPSVKMKLTFKIMKMMQKSNDWNLTDRNYWKDKGWLHKTVPW